MDQKWELDFYHIKDLLKTWEENDRPEMFKEWILREEKDLIERLMKAGEKKLATKVKRMVKETLEKPIPMTALEQECRAASAAMRDTWTSKVQINSNY